MTLESSRPGPLAKGAFKTGDVPSAPGVYIFRDRFGEAIYVGKAADLRKRVSQYFHPSQSSKADAKTRSLINSIDTVEPHVVRTEAEALLLESRLIKQYAPRYNILLRDDKRFLLAKISMSDRFPRMNLVRLRKPDGATYFGPFPQESALRDTVEFLNRHFKLRLCVSPDPGEREFRHCMDAKVKLCCQPCVGKISPEEYGRRAAEVVKILDGDVSGIAATLEEEMTRRSAALEFERAAKLRDMIQNVRSIFGARNRNFQRASLPSPAGKAAVEDLQTALGLSRLPSAIEAFDISNSSDQFAVASLVRFVDGQPERDSYRRFRIKTVSGIDDFAMMREVVSRRFSRLLREGRPMPDLVLVDGGKGQLGMALQAMEAEGVPPFPVLGLAKRMEEIFLPGRDEPVILDRHRPALRLLQAVRDEAHRFAVAYNREIRARKIRESVLDDIPGVGEERKKALLTAYDSLSELRKATPDEIAGKVPGMGHRLAESVAEYLAKGGGHQGSSS